MINYVSGSGNVVRGREIEIAKLLVSSMPESILAKLGVGVACLYFKEIGSLGLAKVTLAFDEDQNVIGYLDIINEDIFSRFLKKHPFHVGLKVLQGILLRKIKLSQLFSSDKTIRTKHEDKIKNLPELSYIFTDSAYKGFGVGKQMLSSLVRENRGLEFYTKTLESNNHVLKMYESVCISVASEFFYEDKTNRYIIIFVVL